MSFQAYLDNIYAKTGKTPDDFRKLAAEKGLTKYGEVTAWLKADYGLGGGHANVIAQLIVNPEKFSTKPDDALAAHFKGDKAKWREPFDTLAAKINQFGPDIKFAANSSYINAQRSGKKFAVLQPSTPERFDVGIKLKGIAPTGRLEASGSWNVMVTHRVRVSDPGEMDAELLGWLKQAYDAVA
jgi:hypothetical protein